MTKRQVDCRPALRQRSRPCGTKVLPVTDLVRQFKVYLPDSLIRAMKHAVIETEQSLSAFVAEAVRKHLDDLGRGVFEEERTEDGR